MGIIGWIVLGLIAGAIAKLIMPGRQGGGFLITMLLGVVGALVGGFIGNFIPGLSNGINHFSIGSIITAVIGSLIVLFIWGKLAHKR